MLDRDLSIISQTAAKAATELAVAEIAAGNQFNEANWHRYHQLVFDAVLDIAGAQTVAPATVDGAAAVRGAFPGATVVQDAPQPPTVTTETGGFLAAQGINPAQLSTARDNKPQEQAIINELDQAPGNFYDNRNDKRNPKAPDFKRKSDGAPLWLR